jgi:hypothetical protein
MMSRSAFFASMTLLAVAAATPTAAQDGGFGNATDPVTGYLCVDRACGSIRLGAKCICVKQNPGEQRLSKLRLKCSTKENGVWVACPVKPRYGISVD